MEQLAEKIQQALETNDWSRLDQLKGWSAPDLAEAIALLANPEQQAQVLQRLEEPYASEVLDYLEPALVEEVFHYLEEEQAARLLQRLPMDDAAQIVAELPAEKAEAMLRLLPPDEAQNVRDLIEYPPHTAGRLMTEKFVRIFPHWTIAQVLEYLRRAEPEVETMNNLYVVDERGHLVGVCSLREVVTAHPQQSIETIMTTDLITVQPETDQEEVARLLAKYDLLAMPVVDALGRLLGIVTVDDVVDVLTSESTEDILKLAAVEAGPEPYMSLSPWEIAKKRIRWLLLLFLAERLTGSVMRDLGPKLQEAASLAYYVPLLIGTAGNAGAQTTTTITRALALGEVRWRHFFQVILRELSIGVIVGIAIGILGLLNALIWRSPLRIALTVASAQLLIIVWATTVGAMLPLLAQRLKIDPAVMSAPFITTLVDATGLIFYFQLAKWIVGF